MTEGAEDPLMLLFSISRRSKLETLASEIRKWPMFRIKVLSPGPVLQAS